MSEIITYFTQNFDIQMPHPRKDLEPENPQSGSEDESDTGSAGRNSDNPGKFTKYATVVVVSGTASLVADSTTMHGSIVTPSTTTECIRHLRRA